MRLGRFTAMVLIAALHLVVPLGLVVWTWARTFPCIATAAAQLFVLAGYTAFIFLMGSWVFASFYLRYLILLISAAAVVRTLLHMGGLPLGVAPGALGWVGYGATAATAAALIPLVVGAIRSFAFEERPVNLAFPFRRGTFAVFEGGNGRVSPLMNYHYGSSAHKGSRTSVSMRYAVDITELTPWGNDAFGFLPVQNEKYAIFHKVLLSPCDGVVSAVEDVWPNETPWSGTPPYNVGNHVVITSGDFAVLMGHLQAGSILVRPGDRVTSGQPIAKTGNSGWTSQPHLHIQAMRVSTGSIWSWEGLPILFDRRNPVKNTLFFA